MRQPNVCLKSNRGLGSLEEFSAPSGDYFEHVVKAVLGSSCVEENFKIQDGDVFKPRRGWCPTETFTASALLILRERFLQPCRDGQPAETPSQMFDRVARCLATVEATPLKQRLWYQCFHEVMATLKFHPGSRVLANAGSSVPQLQNCFVFPLEDDQRRILDVLRASSIVKGLGGGCGFNYSNIRPRGDRVRGVAGLAVGPVALMPMFDLATATFRQQGRYESGNMAVLSVDHPDVMEFIAAKQIDGHLGRTNLSLGVSDNFMEAVCRDEMWQLINPRTKEVVRQIPAMYIFEEACRSAAATGDPGLLFLDRINADNPLRGCFGDIIATNPCGEIGLYPYESCNLGYLNLTKFLLPETERSKRMIFNLHLLAAVVAVGIRMIDNAITASSYPLPEIREATVNNRRLGLGVTGWSDCLALSNIAYDSEEALQLADQLGNVMRQAAQQASFALGSEKGPFPNAEFSDWKDRLLKPRNVAVLAFPPSGNNALIFDTSFSIEPFFAVAYSEKVMGGEVIKHFNRHLESTLRREGRWSDDLWDKIVCNHGSVQGLSSIPDHIQRIYRIAHEIAPEWHIRLQAVFQRHVDNAITKTVNLPAEGSVQQVKTIYKLAWQCGCKGVTVYRDGSRSQQSFMAESAVLSAGTEADSCCA